MRFVALLALVAALPLVGLVSYHLNPDPPRPVEPDWIFLPRETYATHQQGVVVLCQVKTNSRAFTEQQHATPGDVVVETCRAVRAEIATPG